MSIIKAIFFSTLLGLGLTQSLAEKPEAPKQAEQKKCGKCKKDHPDCSGGKCKMKGHHGGMGMGMGEMTATSDGGVVVKMGNTIYKYDKDMKLVGEAEIPFDFKKMHDKMMEKHKDMGASPAKNPDQSKSKK